MLIGFSSDLKNYTLPTLCRLRWLILRADPAQTLIVLIEEYGLYSAGPRKPHVCHIRVSAGMGGVFTYHLIWKVPQS